jgi:hypothetical protein
MGRWTNTKIIAFAPIKTALRQHHRHNLIMMEIGFRPT